ncbi:MAG: hypothetical protein FJ109_18905 [Deltaproteobacteria bacterium]|nr:hypothetical protein [Deltaproteobacteria bacterium]
MQPFSLPDKFERNTRWAYIKDGIEVGPYMAREVLELLSKREIAPDTTLVELNSRRMCPAKEVGPFASYILVLVQEDKTRRSREEFERTRENVVRRARIKVAIGVVVVLGLAVAAVVAVVIFEPFSPKQAKVIDVRPVEDPSQQESKVKKAEVPAEPEFKIIDEGDGDEPDKGKIVKSLKEEEMLSPTKEKLAESRKLEGPAKVKKPRGPRPGSPAGANGEAGVAAGGGVAGADDEAVMDFTDDEGEGGGVEDGAQLARSRLTGVVQKCAAQMLLKYGDTEGMAVEATAQLLPSGRMSGLKLDVTPPSHVGDLKTCISAELGRQRVPPFEGDAVSISTSVNVTNGG